MENLNPFPGTFSCAFHPWEAEDRVSENEVGETNRKSEVVSIRTIMGQVVSHNFRQCVV